MRKYKVEIPDSVFVELEEQALFIAQDSVDAALKWYDHMEAKIKTLETSPARCPVAEESQYFNFEIRHLIIGNYRVLFRIDGTTVKVLHIRGGAQERRPF